jgi:ABC-type transport system involved in cytochrome bd biosynthesis fused ATPase/permease subunit
VSDDGIREYDPKPNGHRVLVLTERISPSIRTAVGWLYPLEHYDKNLALEPLTQYAQLLLIMGSRGVVDTESLDAIMEQARERLADVEYDRLVGYRDLVMFGRVDRSTMDMSAGSGDGAAKAF